MPFYSVDRRGFYRAGEALGLFSEDPQPEVRRRPSGELFSVAEASQHLLSLFPDGLSLHGWDMMTVPIAYTPPPHFQYVTYSPLIEIAFAFVRRSDFPERPSRLQSYLGWLDSDAASAFSRNNGGQPVYQLDSQAAFVADGYWLKIGWRAADTSLCAHRYWAGDMSANSEPEVLLQTPVQVVTRL